MGAGVVEGIGRGGGEVVDEVEMVVDDGDVLCVVVDAACDSSMSVSSGGVVRWDLADVAGLGLWWRGAGSLIFCIW